MMIQSAARTSFQSPRPRRTIHNPISKFQDHPLRAFASLREALVLSSTRHAPPATHHPFRPAFTLLEVLLALGLAVVFSFAVYQAVAVHYAQVDSGRDKVTRAQVIRGVLGQVQQDMRSVFTGWQAVSKDASSASATGDQMEPDEDEDSEDSESDSTQTSASTPDQSAVSASGEPLSEYEVPGGGVLGFHDAVTLVVRRTTAGLNFASDLTIDPTAKPVSDLRLVRYWFGSPGVGSSDSRVGLVRQEIDYVPDVTAGDDPATGARTEVIADDVRSIEFQYFDGSSWNSEWDQTRQSSPLAIQILIAFARPLTPYQIAQNAKEPLDYFRIVVAPSDVQPPKDADADSGGSSTPAANSTSSGTGDGSQDSTSSASSPSNFTPPASLPNLPSSGAGPPPSLPSPGGSRP